LNTFNETLFSIIIPTYNRRERLKLCLESLVNQSYKNFEVIVCDDGSTDNTRELIYLYKEKLDIKYLWEENWGGPAKPRNNGIKLAQSKWICFLDSDDWWYPNKLEACLSYLDKNDIIYHYLDIYNSKGKGKLLKGRKLKEEIFKDLLVNGNALYTSSVIVKKAILETIGGFSESIKLVSLEDFDCWLQISKITNKFFLIEKALGAYWVGNNNISLNVNNYQKVKNIYEKYKSELNEYQNKEFSCRLHYYEGRIELKSHNYSTAINHFEKSLMSHNYEIRIKSIISLLFIKWIVFSNRF